jgi:hypothetical protein
MKQDPTRKEPYMRRSRPKKLELARETVQELDAVVGGHTQCSVQICLPYVSMQPCSGTCTCSCTG